MSVKATDFMTRFFVFAPSFALKEGDESRKLLFFWPNDQDTDRQLKCIGYAEALTKFASNFTNGNEPYVEIGTLKEVEVSCEVEKGYFVVFTTSNDLIKKSRYALRGRVLCHVLHNFYGLFKLFFGRFDEHALKIEGNPYRNADPLRRRLAHFCLRYLDSLRLHLWPLMDLLDGVNYMFADTTNFLRVQSIFNYVTDTFPSVRHCMLLCNDRLLYHTLPSDILILIYRYATEILLPKVFRCELQPENRRPTGPTDLAQEAGNTPSSSPSTSPSSSPVQHDHSTDYGTFITGEAFLFPFMDSSDLDTSLHGFPKVYLYSDHDRKKREHYFVVYKIFTVTLIAFVPSDEPTLLDEFKTALNDTIGTQMYDLACNLTEIWTKLQNESNVQMPYPYIYYNGINRQLYCTLTPTATLAPMAPPHYLYGILCDLKKDMDDSSYYGNVLAKSEGDYWLVAKKAESRELYAMIPSKNSTMIEINEEMNKLCSLKFEHEFLLEL